MDFNSTFSNSSTDNLILDQPYTMVAELSLAQPQLVNVITITQNGALFFTTLNYQVYHIYHK